jgi:hypothetical protein
MAPDQDDPLLAALGRLPAHDIDPTRAAEIRGLAHSALVRGATRSPWAHHVERFYTLVLEPAFVCTVTSVYLTWALQTVNSILTHTP